MERIIFNATNPGDNPAMVTYTPVWEPLLLRQSEDKAFANVYELVPNGDGTYKLRWLSSTLVSTRQN
jgi:hypothetical protein